MNENLKNNKNGPKTFSEELQRMPIDYQRRVKWTLRIGAAWLSLVLGGAGIFLLSRPYMDRRREEKIKSGEFFKELRQGEKNYFGLSKERTYGKTKNPYGKDSDKEDLSPPPYLVGVIDDILKEEELNKDLQ